MASNIFSKRVPNPGDERRPSQQRDSFEQRSENEDPTMALDEENLGTRFQEQNLEQLLAEAANSEIETESTAFLNSRKADQNSKEKNGLRPKWMRGSPAIAPLIEEDDDVPESLLLEGKREKGTRKKDRNRRRPSTDAVEELPPPVPGPSNQATRARWDATRAQQQLHRDDDLRPESSVALRRGGGLMGDPKERALWRWANVDNLDAFLHDVYNYYSGRGFWSMLLYKFLLLFSLVFLIAFSTFMFFCIDYSKLPHSKRLEDIQVPKCAINLPGYWNFLLFLFVTASVFNLMTIIQRIPGLWEMRNFYHHLLDISDSDIQTISWQYVVSKLMALRDANVTTAQDLSPEHRQFLNGQSKQRMDAHDIANRLMRTDNYYIAMINKDILDCGIYIPFIGKRQFFTRCMEWNLQFAITDLIFDKHGQVKPEFITARNRSENIKKLQDRFLLVASIAFISAPFLAFYFMIIQFFRNFTVRVHGLVQVVLHTRAYRIQEYQKNPSELGARTFTPLARWKFREFNELFHLFERRLKMSLPYASRYLEQFPRDKTDQLFRFAALVTGAFAGVLGIVTLLDPGMEVAGKPALFWVGVLAPAYLACRTAAPDDEMVLDPEFALKNVIECTHYCPTSWQGRLHSNEVRQEFSALYQLKIMIFVEEVASVLLCPLVLAFSLPNCAEQIVDFFREFTIHVDGLGHVCSFAVFDFKRGGETGPRANQKPGDHLRDDYYSTKDNKLLESYYNFLDSYGPNPRRHGPNTSRRQQRMFHPPPAFPGLAASGAFGAEFAMPYSRFQHGSGMRHSMHQTPRFGPAAGQTQTSPMHSILLDPHHQPRHLNSPRQVAQRPRMGRHQLDDEVAEADETLGQVPKTSSKVMEEDSQLGDSWALRAEGKEDTDDDGADDDKGVGVLGLLYQFQKAQTEVQRAPL